MHPVGFITRMNFLSPVWPPSVIFLSCHIVILSYCHPVILSYCHTVIFSYSHPVILLYCHNVILSYHHPVILSSRHPVILSSCHIVILSSCHTVILSYPHPIILSSCHPVILSYSHPVILPYCHPVILSYCHPVILSYCHPVILSYFHTVILSTCHTVILSYRHPVILSSCHPVILSYCHPVILWNCPAVWRQLQFPQSKPPVGSCCFLKHSNDDVNHSFYVDIQLRSVSQSETQSRISSYSLIALEIALPSFPEIVHFRISKSQTLLSPPTTTSIKKPPCSTEHFYFQFPFSTLLIQRILSDAKKENVNTSHDIRHFGHAEAFHTQTFAAYEQVEGSFRTYFSPSPFALLFLL